MRKLATGKQWTKKQCLRNEMRHNFFQGHRCNKIWNQNKSGEKRMRKIKSTMHMAAETIKYNIWIKWAITNSTFSLVKGNWKKGEKYFRFNLLLVHKVGREGW